MSPEESPGLARTVFMGTPVLAVPVLTSLISVSSVGLVVTRPDRPRGRSGKAKPPEVKLAALDAGIAVAQPGNRRELAEVLAARGPFDLGVVAAYGMLLPAPVLALPTRGLLNVHFSLLPRWRGASPVVAAISAGDDETGVTIMLMDEGLDTGPVVAACSTVIGDHETGGTLTSRLALLGAELLAGTLDPWVEGRIRAVPQDSTKASYAPLLEGTDRRLDLSLPPEVVARKVRALAPRPGATLLLDGTPHRVLVAEPTGLPLANGALVWWDDAMVVGTGGAGLRVLVIQAPGGQPLKTPEWLRGLRQPPARAG